MHLEEDMENLGLMEEDLIANDKTLFLKKCGRFDSSACLIVPNEYRITPNPERSISEMSK